jgi:hypothetical protein
MFCCLPDVEIRQRPIRGVFHQALKGINMIIIMTIIVIISVQLIKQEQRDERQLVIFK